ncbi:HAD family hydrolase [Actinomadura sp. BRA 177]|uniref:HAD family hydrolase n=1 Tax=Actinomadura sp. BRA 177 TaxID=2745202 RepID=UPI001595D46A|nr:HAD family hydrolase [Actinomadura sp. BRA 177]NVI91714.1 HAD family hydrolase [Actinomadura sp. BRA 177]
MIDAVLFDVDGTLVDTNYLHATTWWQAFLQYGHTVPMGNIHRAIGMGSDKLLDHLLPDGRDRDADDAIRSAHTALYAQYWSRLTPFDGAADLLRACAGWGNRVVLASSAAVPELKALRAALDADDAIDEATSASEVEESKPSPDLVQLALERAGVPADRAVFVGDTRWDVEAAARAGMPCVCVLSGGWSRDELQEAGAAAVYDGPRALLDDLGASPLT